MANTLYINEIDFTLCASGIQGYKESFGFDSETSTVTFGSSSKIVLVEEGFEYIRDKFFGDCLEVLDVRVKVGICKEIFDYKIFPTDVKICCNKCYAEVELTSDSEDLIKFACLNSEIAISDGFLEYKEHLFYQVVFGDNGAQLGGLTGYLVRDIISYHTERCSVKLKDNVFSSPASPFYNLAFVPNGSIQEDLTVNPNNVNLGQYNTDTFIDFLTRIVKTANADFYIQNCELCIDKIENIRNDISGLIDLTNVLTEDEICITKEESSNCAYLKLSYLDDPTIPQLTGKFYADLYQSITPFTNDENLVGKCEESIDFGVLPPALILNQQREVLIDTLFIWDGNNNNPAGVGGICAVPPLGNFLQNGTLSTSQNAQCDGTYQSYEDTYLPSRTDCNYIVSGFCFCPDDFCEAVRVIREYGLNTAFKINTCGREIIVKLPKESFEIEIDYNQGIICLNDLGFGENNL